MCIILTADNSASLVTEYKQSRCLFGSVMPASLIGTHKIRTHVVDVKENFRNEFKFSN